MARREVIEVLCDRCNRTETQAPGSAPKTTGPEATFKLHDQEVTYGDLCRRCRDTLVNYFSKIIKEKTDNEDSPPVSITGEDSDAAKKGSILNRLGKAAG